MQRNDHICFGIGCFHFSFNTHKGKTFTGKDYITKLDNVLGKIANIEDINIEADDEFKNGSYEADTFENLIESYHFFPFPGAFIEITFTLFLPERIQKNFKQNLKFLDTSCERFKVRLHYPYYFPITIVEALNDDPEYEPSNGVILCREFLDNCFRDSEETEIIFETLGPSPFHADFFLIPSEKKELHRFDFERTPSHGYDRIVFRYNPDDFDDVEETFQDLIYHLDSQLGFFYRVVHSRVQRDRNWEGFYQELQELINEQNEKGIKAYWKNTFRTEYLLNRMMLELAQLESFDLSIRYSLNKDLKETYLGDKPPELLSHLNIALSELVHLPFQQVREILNLLEARRSKRINTLIMLLSAILGGAVGAWLTISLKLIG